MPNVTVLVVCGLVPWPEIQCSEKMRGRHFTATTNVSVFNEQSYYYYYVVVIVVVDVVVLLLLLFVVMYYYFNFINLTVQAQEGYSSCLVCLSRSDFGDY